MLSNISNIFMRPKPHICCPIIIFIYFWQHPDYVPAGGYPNDIAVVKLSAPVNPFENFVNTVCIPEQGEVFEENDDCYMTGWGATLGKSGYEYI